MVFSDSKNVIRTRLRTAMYKLKPSKSSLDLPMFLEEAEMSDFRAVSPVPLPVLTLPSISSRLTIGTLFQVPIRDSILFNEAQNLIQPCATDSPKSEWTDKLDDVSESSDMFFGRQRMLGSSISLPLTRLDPISSFAPCPMTPEAHLEYPTRLIRTNTSGPYTPELVDNPMARVTPHSSSINTGTPDSDEYFSLVSTTSDSDQTEIHESFSTPPTSLSSKNSLTTQSVGIRPIDAINQNIYSPTSKVSASPVRRFLPRPGPFPNTQPLSPKILKSISSPTRLTTSSYTSS